MKTNRMKMNYLKIRGVSLAELIIVMVIIAILTVIALPAYSNYVSRNKLTVAVTNLQDLRLRMEQFYQDNRTYMNNDGDACAIDMPALENFTISCTGITRTTYTLSAVNKSGVGLGDPGDYEYTIDEDGNMATVIFKGSSVNKPCLTVSNKC